MTEIKLKIERRPSGWNVLVYVSRRGVWSTVNTTPFATKAEAEQFLKSLLPAQ